MIERELKLTAPDKSTLDKIVGSSLIKNYCQSDPDAGPIPFKAIYYDTENLDLEHARCGLRARMEGDRMVAALKMPGEIVDGLSERVELESALDQWPRQFSDFPKGAVLSKLAQLISLDDTMVERVSVTMERRIRKIKLHGSKIELAADHGTITGLYGEQTLSEIELELKSGSIEPMLALGERLASVYKLEPSTTTKLGIGLSLCKIKDVSD